MNTRGVLGGVPEHLRSFQASPEHIKNDDQMLTEFQINHLLFSPVDSKTHYQYDLKIQKDHKHSFKISYNFTLCKVIITTSKLHLEQK